MHIFGRFQPRNTPNISRHSMILSYCQAIYFLEKKLDQRSTPEMPAFCSNILVRTRRKCEFYEFNKKLSCRRDRATLRVIEFFAKLLKITQCH